MKSTFTFPIIAAIFVATSASAQVKSNGSVNVQTTPQGSTVIVQGGASVPLSKTIVVTPQIQVVVPPSATNAPPVITSGIGVTIQF